jgi:hypothetical protein
MIGREVCLLMLLIGISISFTLNDKDDHNCGGNCMNNNCDVCICGERTNYVDVNAICNQPLWSSSCCQCIVHIMSKCNANAIVMSDNKVKVGLFQINSYDWMTCNHGKPPCDPAANLICAMQIYRMSGSTWKQYWPEAASKCGCK